MYLNVGDLCKLKSPNVSSYICVAPNWKKIVKEIAALVNFRRISKILDG
jgi:hypothetical protein